ncbi:MAG TPA: hypothetical protein V6C90_24330 [Coleofasciculaceae cyanobacterium]
MAYYLNIQDLRIRPPSPPNLGGTGFTPPKVGGGLHDGVCVSPDIITGGKTSRFFPSGYTGRLFVSSVGLLT